MPAPSAPPSLTAPPTAPSRNDAPPTFIARMNAFLAWIITFVSEMGTMATALYAYATSAYTDAGTATTKASDATAAAEIATTKAGEASGYADDAQGYASDASDYATAAAGSASQAAGFVATSTTSMAIGTGSKTLTIQASKSFSAGDNILVKRTAAPTTTYVTAKVDSYNSSTGVLNFTVPTGGAVGSGTYTDWTVTLSGETGATGATGATPSLASNAEVAALSSTTKALSPGSLGGALAPVDDGSGSGTYTPDLSAGPNHKRTVTGTTTIAALSNPKAGEGFSLRIIQDGTGSRSVSYNSGYKFPPANTPSFSTTANAIDLIVGTVVTESPFRAECVFVKGYS